MEWFKELSKPDGPLTLYFENEVVELLSLFAKFIEEADAKTCFGVGDLSKDVLKTLVGTETLHDDFMTWMVMNINQHSTDALAFAYSEDIFEGRLTDSYLERVSEVDKDHISKLIVFLNVGKVPELHYPGETYLTIDDTSVEGKTLRAGHSALVVLDMDSGIARYCDSLGWSHPIVLGSVLDTCLIQLKTLLSKFPQEVQIQEVKEVHNSEFTTITGHRCRRRSSRPCSQYYPFQTCHKICGIGVVICGALAAYEYPVFDNLVSTDSKVCKVSYLQNVTSHSDFLRVVLVKWYVEGRVVVADLFSRGTRKISTSNEAPPSKKLRMNNDKQPSDALAEDRPSSMDQERCEPLDTAMQASDHLRLPLPLEDQASSYQDTEAYINLNDPQDVPLASHIQDKLFSKRSISSSLQLNTLFGYKWKLIGRKDAHQKNSSLLSKKKGLKMQYVCVDSNCKGAFLCSVANPVTKIRTFKLVALHSCKVRANSTCPSRRGWWTHGAVPQFSVISSVPENVGQAEPSAEDHGEVSVPIEVVQVINNLVEEVTNVADPESTNNIQSSTPSSCGIQCVEPVPVEIDSGSMASKDDLAKDMINLTKTCNTNQHGILEAVDPIIKNNLSKVENPIKLESIEVIEVEPQGEMAVDKLGGSTEPEVIDLAGVCAGSFTCNTDVLDLTKNQNDLEIIMEKVDLTAGEEAEGIEVDNVPSNSHTNVDNSPVPQDESDEDDYNPDFNINEPGPFNSTSNEQWDDVSNFDDIEPTLLIKNVSDVMSISNIKSDTQVKNESRSNHSLTKVKDITLQETGASRNSSEVGFNMTLEETEEEEDKLGPLLIQKREDLPMVPQTPALYIFPAESKKLGKGKRMDIQTWGSGSNNEKGVTSYICRQSCSGCVARKFVWVCSGNCKDPKDEKCCKESQRRGGTYLYTSYQGMHSCKNPVDNIKGSAMANKAMEGKSLVERAQMKYSNLQIVDSIPVQLVGDDVFLLKCLQPCPGPILQKLINDGRSYSRYSTTSIELKALFPGSEDTTIVGFQCNGSMVCNNSLCPASKRFNVVLQIHAKDGNKCYSCKEKLTYFPCEAKKKVAFQNRTAMENEIIITYIGAHCCLAKHKVEGRTIKLLSDYFRDHPGVIPSVAWFNIISAKILDDAPEDEIHQLVLAQVHSWVLGNIKAVAVKDKLPTNLTELIELLKKKFIEKYPRYGLILDYHKSSLICLDCGKLTVGLNVEVCSHCHQENVHETGEMIFLSSKHSLETMNGMGVENKLDEQCCHVDHQPSRTKDWNTFEGVCFDPELSKVATLFTVHQVQSTEFHVRAAFLYVLNILKQHDKSFKPLGFVSDNATAIKNAIRNVFGPEMPQNADNFHFTKNAVEMLSGEIGSKNDQIRFMKFVHQLQEASDPATYHLMYDTFQGWIHENEVREKKLVPYLNYWHPRRFDWCLGYKNKAVEEHSLSEAGNSKMARRGVNKNSAIGECLQWEMLVYMQDTIRVEEYVRGNYRPQGRTRIDLMEKSMERDYNRLKKSSVDGSDMSSVLSDMLKQMKLPPTYLDQDKVEQASASFVNVNLGAEDVPAHDDNDFKHREAKVNLRKSKANVQRPKANGKGKVLRKCGRPLGSKKGKASHTDTVQTSESEEEEDGKCARKLPKDAVDKVKEMGNYEVRHLDQLRFKVAGGQCDYLVTFHVEERRVECACPDFVKKKGGTQRLTNCKHIILVLITIGVPWTSGILAKHAVDDGPLTESELLGLQRLRNEWLLKPSKPILNNNQGKQQQKVNDDSFFTTTQAVNNELQKRPPRWTACYYVRPKGRRGSPHHCSAKECALSPGAKNNPMIPNEMCLKLEYAKYHTRNPKTPQQQYCVQTLTRYFCVNKECVISASSNVKKFSNFVKPTLNCINVQSLTEDDCSSLRTKLHGL